MSESIFDLFPLETGGTNNRKGIAFQDHVAANFCLDMLIDSSLLEVWCETQDDITLIWKMSGPCVEFVQVKSDEMDSLWSIAKLCGRDKSKKVAADPQKPTKGTSKLEKLKKGTSILEKSFANDRVKEPCLFRMVTARDVNSDLKILTYRLGAPGRKNGEKEETQLIAEVSKLVGDYTSPNGNDARFWIKKAVWDVMHSEVV